MSNGSTPSVFKVLFLSATVVMAGSGLHSAVNLQELIQPGQATARLALPVLASEIAGTFNVDTAQRRGLEWQVFLALLSLLCALFVLIFSIRTRPSSMPDRATHRGLLAAQMLVAVLLDPWIEPGLVYLIAAEFAFILPYRTALKWLVMQIALICASTLPSVAHAEQIGVMCNVAGIYPPPASVLLAMGWIEGGAFQIFMFFIGHFSASEMRNRLKVERLYEQLSAAQAKLAESARSSERVRISNHLQAEMQERLTELNHHMSRAARESDARIFEPVQCAHRLMPRLSIELQAFLDAGSSPIDLKKSLETLCLEIPSPRIVLHFDASLKIDSPSLAHSIFRIIQEATTNAVRHSGANRLEIAVIESDGTIDILIEDNGRGITKPDSPTSGIGLMGMRERVAEHGGSLQMLHPLAGGFGLRISLPQAGATR